MAPWTRPVFDVLREYFHAVEIEKMIEEGVIEISPLAYMRGRTFKNAFIVADEMQNATPNQMKMLLTRLGEGSQMVVTGDLNQADRLTDNGLIDFVNHLKNSSVSRISPVFFVKGDVERHEAVKEVLEIYGDE
jgi:Phosphate starvation-inducible protein PhoH, predicted ATPase